MSRTIIKICKNTRLEEVEKNVNDWLAKMHEDYQGVEVVSMRQSVLTFKNEINYILTICVKYRQP